MLGRVSSPQSKSPRHRVASLCLCAVLALTLAGANAPAAMSAASLGGNSALSELTEGGTTATTQTTATNAAATESTNSKGTIIIALVAAAVLLIGIAFVIVRDARRVAPLADGQLVDSRPAHDSAATLRKRRAKAKAARRQRKRNR